MDERQASILKEWVAAGEAAQQAFSKIRRLEQERDDERDDENLWSWDWSKRLGKARTIASILAARAEACFDEFCEVARRDCSNRCLLCGEDLGRAKFVLPFKSSLGACKIHVTCEQEMRDEPVSTDFFTVEFPYGIRGRNA